MSKETFALINEQDQVVNHIVIDKDDTNFESNMAGQLEHWGCVRYVETDIEKDLIIIDESPLIWTTHTEADGFVVPVGYNTEIIETPAEVIEKPLWDGSKVTINGREYPSDSLLIKENAQYRYTGWVVPVDEVEVSLSDAE
jgi:hypothetical protein